MRAVGTRPPSSSRRRAVTPPARPPTPRPGARARRLRPLVPYALLAPALLVLAAILGFPLYRLVSLSFQQYGLKELFAGRGTWIGLRNYQDILTDGFFWTVVARTVLFAAVCVGLTMGLGTLVALLLRNLGRPMRVLVTAGLVAAWAMPTLTAVSIWQWLFDFEFGLVNWLLTRLGFGDLTQHDWTTTPASAFTLVWLLVVWQSVPFAALTLHAGLSQIPRSYYEAAALDGARPWRVHRTITFPFLQPILGLVTILSVIWDFTVFNQIWILTQGGPNDGTTTLGIWTFTRAFSRNDFGQGAAIAVVSVALLVAMTAVYVRRLVRSGEDL